MKHKLFLRRCFASLLLLAASTMSWAEVVEINGIFYDVITKAKLAEVTKDPNGGKYTGSIIIPETVTYEGKECSVTSIGSSAFYECSSLTSITIPESVTSIGYEAFRDCDGLTSITIPKSVTSIGHGAFFSCYGLKSITIPESVTSIGHSAFGDCSGLTSITIPESVTSIGESTFSGCSRLSSITIPNSVTTIDAYAFWGCSRLTSVKIGNGVTSIGNYAFHLCPLAKAEFASIESYCNISFEGNSSNPLIITGHLYIDGQEVKDLIIPNSVTSIGSSAFRNCSGLTSITIPNSVTSIGGSAFYGCSGLTSITIPNSVTSIGGSAFYGCSGLTSVTIPESVTSIGYETFCGCSSLTSVLIPNSVMSIGSYAFSGCSGLTSITIPNSVTSIGSSAFSGCSGLTSITIPNSVTSIGYGAFQKCSELTDLYCFAKKVPGTGNDVFADSYVEYATLHVPASSIDAYKAASQWKDFGTIVAVVIPATAIALNESEAKLLIGSTLQLTATVEPEDASQEVTWTSSNPSVATVNESGLVSAVGIGTAVITATTTDGTDLSASCHVTVNDVIDSGTFGDNLTYTIRTNGQLTISGTGAMPDFGDPSRAPWYKNKSSIKSAVIEDGVTYIGEFAFDYYGDLTSVKIPASVTGIGDFAFTGCKGLKKAEFASIESLCGISFIGRSGGYIDNNPLYFAKHLYIDGKEVTNLVIPNSVTKITGFNFYGCAGLTSVTIPKSVTNISASAFRACEGLESIKVSADNPKYDSRNGCNAIMETASNTIVVGCKNTTFPENTASIGWAAFYDCTGLTSVSIPSSVQSIDDYAFYGCTGLPVENGLRYADTYLVEAVDKTQNTYYIKEGIKYIGTEAFRDCKNLTEIKIPESTKYICEYAFRDCSSLTSVTIPSNVMTIDYEAFAYCSALTSVLIPESVTRIDTQVFLDCSNLTAVTIGNGVTYIGFYAFKNCTGLTSVTCLAKRVPSLREGVFDNVPLNQATLYVPASVVKAYGIDPWKNFGTITPLYADATSVTLNETKTMLNQTGQCQLTATVEPEDAVQTVTWASSNPNVAAVDENGLVKALSAGTAVITATTTDGTNLSASCEVTVSDIIISGSCGENVNYELRGDMRLVISGTGAMTDYKYSSDNPWVNYRESIKSVVIEDGVTSIGEGAFAYCTGLVSVTIPNSVASIGRFAFEGCSALTSVTIPKSVMSIGIRAFESKVLETITVEEGNTVYDSRDNCNAIIETASGALLNGCKNSVIPEGVKSIGEAAFSYCTGLTSIVLPKSVTGIGSYAFYGCTGLTSVTISDKRSSARQSFKSATSIVPATADGTLTDIGYQAFYGCSALTTVNIPEGVTSIGGEAFSGCSALESINIPGSVTSVGTYAFLGCTNLPMTDGVRYADTYLVRAVSDQGTYNIKEGTRFIGNNAFEYSYNLTSLTIPESVITIGSSAFYKCPELTSISIPNSVSSIGGGAFEDCSSLNSIDIPNSVTSIGGKAFRNCGSITSVTIPENVTSIGNGAFYACNNLTEVTVNTPNVFYYPNIFGSQVERYTLGAQVTQVGQYALAGCTKLKTVVLGNGVERIGENAFQGCNSLSSINIPESVTYIDNNAFGGCVNLPVTNGIRYADTYLVEVLDKTQRGYSIKSGTRFIGSNAFNECAAMTSIAIPESVESIGASAFAWCSRLESVNIPKSVLWIEDYSFSGCFSLDGVTIPASVRYIGSGAFAYCTGLKTVTCQVTETDRDPESYATDEPVMPKPGVDPNDIPTTDYLYPFNPAHNTELDPPTTANCEETTDVTTDNLYTEDEVKALWLDYYKKLYNTRMATQKRNNKWNALRPNPYIKADESTCLRLTEYRNQWNQYLADLEMYELYQVYKKYPTVPVPLTSDDAFEGVDQENATLYVYESVKDAYEVTSPWSLFGNIKPIDPSAVEEIEASEETGVNANAPIYDLNGRRLTEKPASGYYIQGGKIYLAK